jgi:outer membrane lipoprotein carrier protein
MKPLLTLTLLLGTLNATLSLPQSFETSFVQNITNDKGKTIEYQGEVLFQHMGQDIFKWNYTAPTQKEVCTDGIQLTVVDHDLEQVSTYLIQEGIDLKSILDVAQPITTRDYKAVYKDVEYLITLDEQNQLQKVVYVDNLDNKVKIVFSNMRYNGEIDSKRLECTAPQEYDILKG